MGDNRKISLCIPTYNRFELLLESFDKVKDDPRISEICIFSDGSSKEYEKKYWNTFLKQNTIKYEVPSLGEVEETTLVGSDTYPKVKLHLCPNNLGVHRAKKEAVNMASNEWVILFDSDNKIDVDYLDTIFNILKWDEGVAYQPSYLAPHFDFRDKSGWVTYRGNLYQKLAIPNNKIDTWGNAQNFFINKAQYLEIWEEGENVNGNDSLWFFYLWMKAGNYMYLVPNLQYFHRIHDNTTKEQKGNYNSDPQAGYKVNQIMNLLRNLNGNQS